MQISVRKRLISFVAIIAFVIKIMLPLLATYSVASASEEANPLGQKILICTANGLKWVSLEDIENKENSSKNHGVYDCFLCQLAKNNAKDIAQIESFFALDSNFYISNVNYINDYDSNLERSLSSPTPPSRAPPVFV